MAGIIRSNIHTHTVFSDGKSTAEEYVRAAIDKGWVSVGFSEHNYTPYDGDCCVPKENMPDYYAEIKRLRKVYGGQIEICLGLEGDYYYPTPLEEIQYWIGSAHYLRDEATGEYYTIDYLPQTFKQAVELIAGGSVQRLVELYYEAISDLVLSQKPDIVGHMDLIVKLNRRYNFFDATGSWYQTATDQVIEAAARTGCMVEVNTGSVFRGYTDVPYPSFDIICRLREAGVPMIISSDAHSVDGLDYWFDEAVQLLKKAGYHTVRQMQGGRFVDTPLE